MRAWDPRDHFVCNCIRNTTVNKGLKLGTFASIVPNNSYIVTFFLQCC